MTRVSAVVLATTNRGERARRLIALAAQYRSVRSVCGATLAASNDRMRAGAVVALSSAYKDVRSARAIACAANNHRMSRIRNAVLAADCHRINAFGIAPAAAA